MFCDINPEHGEMKIEPMYGKDMEIRQYGWFCQAPDCDGYGGLANVKPARKVAEADDKTKPMSLFETA